MSRPPPADFGFQPRTTGGNPAGDQVNSVSCRLVWGVAGRVRDGHPTRAGRADQLRDLPGRETPASWIRGDQFERPDDPRSRPVRWPARGCNAAVNDCSW